MNTHLRRRDTLALCALSAFTGRAAAAPDVQDDTWRDSARSRDIPVRLRWPTSPGPWPLLLYSHGLGGNRDGGDVWGQAWCEAGFVVLHVQHPGSDTEVLRSGGVSALRAAGNAQQLLARVADMRFVLDEATRRQSDGERAWRSVRLDAVGMAGHSFGAVTTLALAGQRYPVPGDLSDRRLQAFLALSPTSARSRLSLQEQFGRITRPFMAITGSLDGDPFGAYDTGEPRAQVYEGLPPGQRALLWLDGADHMTFGGNREQRIRGRGPFQRAAVAQQREDAHHALVASLSTLWWRWRLLADTAAQDLLRQAPDGVRWSPKDRLTLG
jgi:predicted dienelactone hydrolase